MKVAFVQFSAGRTGSTFSGMLACKAFLEAGAEVHATFAHDGEMIAEYEALGCTTNIIPHKSPFRSVRPLYAARNVLTERRNSRAFESFFRELSPDIVYVNTTVSLAGAIGGRKCGIPVVWHLREMTSGQGGEVGIPNKLCHKLLSRTLSGYATVIVAISRAVAADLLGKTEADNLAIIPNAVSDGYFAPETKGSLPVDLSGTIIGIPGTLRPMKGHDFLLDAIPKVLAEESSCHFVISGSGEADYVKWLEELARTAGVADRVHFIGSISNMIDFYDACDFVVVPSRQEPFGRVAIEAFARRRAVVASAVGGLCEIIRDEENGLLVQYGDSSGLAKAVLSLCRELPLRESLVEKAHADVKCRYSETAHKKSIREAVQRVLPLTP